MRPIPVVVLFSIAIGTNIIRKKTEHVHEKERNALEREVICMEQIILMMAQYADIACMALAVLTVMITGITLHKLKKLEKELFQPKERVQQKNTKADEPVKISDQIQEKEVVAATVTGEQEQLLDAVLGEVFP